MPRKKSDKNKKLMEKLDQLENQYENTVEHLVWEASQLVTERPDGDGWQLLTDKYEKGLLAPDHRSMIQQAREFYRSNSHAHGAIELMIHYIMGQGIMITPKSEDPVAQFVWREFWNAERNGMEARQFEIVRRVLRDGEVFLEFFDDNKSGKSTIRFVDPLNVQNPGTKMSVMNQSNMSHGIEFDPDDLETKVRYWVKKGKTNDFRSVESSKMIHSKAFADSDQMRGESWLLAAMRMFKLYKQWLDARIMLNKIRTSIALIKKIKGGQSDVERLRSTLSHAQPQRVGETKREQFRPGSMVTANAGVEYEYLSPNLNATDASEDGRAMKLDMAAALNLPEYALGDASNSNFASSLIAESPFVKAIQYWQKYFEYVFGLIGRRVFQVAVKAGLIMEPDDSVYFDKLRDLSNLSEQDDIEKMKSGLLINGKVIPPSEIFYGFDVQWPQIVHRDFKAFTEALVAAKMAGWISDPTASAALGFEYEEELRKQKQVENKAETDRNPLADKGPDDQEDEMGQNELGAEIDNVFKSMTPEEREKLLNSGDSGEMAQLILSKLKFPQNGDNQ